LVAMQMSAATSQTACAVSLGAVKKTPSTMRIFVDYSKVRREEEKVG
jgi:hypothetical protein